MSLSVNDLAQGLSGGNLVSVGGISFEKLSGSNYDIWSKRMMLVLETNDLWDVVQKDVPSEEKKTDAWKSSNRKACLFITVAVTDLVFQSLSQTTLAAEIWRSLEKVYRPKSLLNKVIWRRRLEGICLHEGDDVREHINQVRMCNQNLSSMACGLDDKELTMRLMLSLPASYDSLIDALESVKEDELTFDYLASRLMNHDLRRREVANMPNRVGGSSDSAFLMNQGQRYGRNNGGNNGGNNNGNNGSNSGGNNGSNSGNFGNGSTNNVKVSNIICHLCKEPGHIKRKCPKNDNNRNNQGNFWRANHGRYRRENGNGAGTNALLMRESSFANMDDQPYSALMTTVMKAPSVFTTHCYSMKHSPDAWYLDSAATQHMSGDRSLFKDDFHPIDATPVFMGDNTCINAVGTGNVMLKKSMVSSGEADMVLLRNVLFVPELKVNLVSVHRLDKVGCVMVFQEGRCLINRDNKVLAQAIEEGGLYKLQVVKMKDSIVRSPLKTDSKSYAAATSTTTTNVVKNDKNCSSDMPKDVELWHRRLGHLSETSTRLLLKSCRLSYSPNVGLPMNFIKNPSLFKLQGLCEGCVYGKHHRMPISSATDNTKPVLRSSKLLELIHSDICGPMSVASFGGSRYFATFVDDFSRYVHVYTLKQKSELPLVFHDFVVMVQKQMSSSGSDNGHYQVKRIRSDNAQEYVGKGFQTVCKKFGIIHELSAPYTPEQNGVAERMNRTLVELARSMLYSMNMPTAFWAEAIHTAAYIRNRVPGRWNAKDKLIEIEQVDGATEVEQDRYGDVCTCPYESWHKKKPSFSHLKVFGCVAYGHIDVSLRTKWDAKAIKCVMVGYCDGDRAWRLWNPKSKRFIGCRSVIFDEKTPFFKEETVSAASSHKTGKWKSQGSPFLSLDQVSVYNIENINHVHINGNNGNNDDNNEVQGDDIAVGLEEEEKDDDREGADDIALIQADNSDAHRHMAYPHHGRSVEHGSVGAGITHDKQSVAPIQPLRRSTRSNIGQKPSEWWISPHSSSSSSSSLYSSSPVVSLTDVQENKEKYEEEDKDEHLSATNMNNRVMQAVYGGDCEEDVHVWEPNTYKQAMNSKNASEWQSAYDEEMKSLEETDTYEWAMLPNGKKCVGSRCIFKVKYKSDGKRVDRFKVRIVAKGFTQVEGVDYHETYAPVVKMTSIRVLLALVAWFDLELHQMDVKTAFLNGKLEEEVYMKPPDGVVPRYSQNNVPMVWRLKKALYGLKQSPRVWYHTIDAFFSSLGYQRVDGDFGLYVMWNNDIQCVIALYVDDILLACNNMGHLMRLKQQLKEQYEMKDVGNADFILGIKIERDRRSRLVYLSQEAYIKEVLERFRMQDCNPVSTPLDGNVVLTQDMLNNQGRANGIGSDEDAAGNKSSAIDHTYRGFEENDQAPAWDVPYQSAVGSLMYAMICTRPDIAFAVSFVSRFSNKPLRGHWRAVKHILRYLKGSSHLRLCLGKKNSDDHEARMLDTTQPPIIVADEIKRRTHVELKGYCDADWGSDMDARRSTSGYVFYVGDGVVSWCSKRQPTAALSTAEAEYMSITLACQEALWMKQLLEQLGVPVHTNASKALCTDNENVTDTTVILLCDNRSAIDMTKNPAHHSRTKHIDIKHHFIRKEVEDGTVALKHVPTAKMVADILTKRLPRDKHNVCVKMLGLC